MRLFEDGRPAAYMKDGVFVYRGTPGATRVVWLDESKRWVADMGGGANRKK